MSSPFPVHQAFCSIVWRECGDSDRLSQPTTINRDRYPLELLRFPIRLAPLGKLFFFLNGPPGSLTLIFFFRAIADRRVPRVLNELFLILSCNPFSAATELFALFLLKLFPFFNDGGGLTPPFFPPQL